MFTCTPSITSIHPHTTNHISSPDTPPITSSDLSATNSIYSPVHHQSHQSRQFTSTPPITPVQRFRYNHIWSRAQHQSHLSTCTPPITRVNLLTTNNICSPVRYQSHLFTCTPPITLVHLSPPISPVHLFTTNNICSPLCQQSHPFTYIPPPFTPVYICSPIQSSPAFTIWHFLHWKSAGWAFCAEVKRGRWGRKLSMVLRQVLQRHTQQVYAYIIWPIPRWRCKFSKGWDGQVVPGTAAVRRRRHR